MSEPWLVDRWALWATAALRPLERWLRARPGIFGRIACSYPEAIATWLSRYAAYATFERTAREVPAYRDLLQREGWVPRSRTVQDRLDSLPLLTKDTYVRQYSIEERCVGGRIPMDGTAVDESSGSSGKPTNWVRGREERANVYRLEQAAHPVLFGRTDLFTINAFSMGAWATGLMVTVGLDSVGIIKTIGPDVEKIIDTLRIFGPRYTYVIYGYPPFLKLLIEAGREQGLPWQDYTLYGMTGGEGMSEGLRTCLEEVFVRAYSVYGASDLEVGVGFESPLTVAVRKLAHEREDVRGALFGEESGVLPVPMLFHYDPLLHYVEAPHGTLVVTTTSPQLAPKPRYDIRDQGGVLSWRRFTAALRGLGIEPRNLLRPGEALIQMPMLYTFGRVDHTVSCMGVNVYPEDVQHALYGDLELAAAVRRFWLAAEDDKDGNPRVSYHLELVPGRKAEAALIDHARDVLTRELARLNRDFQAGLAESPLIIPVVHLHLAESIPAQAQSLKLRYIS